MCYEKQASEAKQSKASTVETWEQPTRQHFTWQADFLFSFFHLAGSIII
jgi:hypothetical protein